MGSAITAEPRKSEQRSHFLGFDGLIAPSARWACDNLTILIENHALTERLEPVGEEQVDWYVWARDHGILPAEK